MSRIIAHGIYITHTLLCMIMFEFVMCGVSVPMQQETEKKVYTTVMSKNSNLEVKKHLHRGVSW